MSARKIVLFLALAVPAWACSEKPNPNARQALPPNLVPTTAIVNRQPKDPFTPPPAFLAYNVLPESDTEILFPRGQREAIGITPLYEYYSYSIYTYDQQDLGIPFYGYGYRYGWRQESGVYAPAPGY